MAWKRDRKNGDWRNGKNRSRAVGIQFKKNGILIGGTYRDFGDLVGGKETGVQSPSGYTEYAFDGKLLFALKENMQLTLASQFLNQSHVPVYHKVVLENYAVNEFQPQQRLMNYARLNIQGEKKYSTR
jgi:hemoglobin/transferrin/lactoferrin receptor protein